jgi:protein-tyrosine-phosphatase
VVAQQSNSANTVIQNVSKMNYLAAIQPNLLMEKGKVDKGATKLRSDEGNVEMADEEVMESDVASKVTQKKQLTESSIKSLDKILSLIDSNIEEIKKIAQEYSIIKQIANQVGTTSEDNSKWVTLFLPFNYNQKVVEHEIKVEKSRSHYLKFIIDIDFEDNQMQLEGLIKFTEGSNKPKSFDMLIRSKKFLSNELTKGIYEIYQTSQEITGIGGNFLYELGADFIDTSN